MAACVVSTLLAGCGSTAGPVASPSTTISGIVTSGQQSVSGAIITLYAAGLTGNGAGAINLLAPQSVTTNANGNFTIPSGSYTCPASDPPVYLVAQGGVPGLAVGTNNPALLLVAALGDCGGFATAFTHINEVTTVAAAWSLSQFFGSGAQAGASATNLKGIRNAFATAALLANTTTGATPGTSLPTGTSVESSKINSLANALAQCAGSDGTTNCHLLFIAAAVGGIPPTHTFDAALNIVRNPGANVGPVFAAANGSVPFQPKLVSAPNDWTLSINYGNCSHTCGGLNVPGDIAIDSGGNVWVANYFGGSVSEFSPTGAPAAASGFPGKGLYQSYGITIDASDNVWVTNEQSVSAAGNSRLGSISKFNSSGTELSANGYTGGGVYYPQAIAATPSGSIWIADYGSSSATLLANDGSAISGSTGYAQSALPFTSSVAVDAAQNAWFAVQGGAARVTPSGVVNTFACCTAPAGVAVDRSGNVWLADYGSYSIVELSSTGQQMASVSTAAALISPQGIAIDGAGNVWAVNYFGNSITSLAGASATLRSPAAGFGRDAAISEPYGIAIDASGNLWFSNSGDDTLGELVGIASPIRTPLLGPPSTP